MALPHLKSSVFTTRKNIYEAAIVHRRNYENDYREKWSNTAQYFRKEDVKATKQKAWESDQCFNNSMDAWRLQQEKDNKQVNLKRRRSKLADLLEKERLEYHAQLRGYSMDNALRLREMKDKSEALRSAREERQKQVAEEKLYEHWRINSPDLRQLESEVHKKLVIDTWEEQELAKKEKEKEEKQQKAKDEAIEEFERLAALEMDKQQEQDKINSEKELKAILVKQMEELKQREKEAEKFKAEEDTLLRRQWEIEQMESERKQIEAERQRQQLGRVLLRQHAAALRRKSKKIQEELEQDKKYLELLVKRETEDKMMQSARQEKAKANASWMKKVLEDQIKLEKQREQELDMLYQDEAAKVWEQRECEWSREREARQRLMQQVLNERQQQIQHRMQTVKQAQQESLERREELLQELEYANQMTKREIEHKQIARSEQKQAIDAQIIAKKEANKSEFKLQLHELEQDKQNEENYAKMVDREAKKLSARAFQEKNYGRKQAWI